MLLSTPGMFFTILGAGLSYEISKSSAWHTPVIILFTYLFMVCYSFGMGPVPFTISSEVFPLEHRMVGMSCAVSTNLMGAGLLALFVPVITYSHFQNEGLLAIFAVLNVVAFFLIAFFVRETSGAAVRGDANSAKSLSLEQLSLIFSVKTRTYITHVRTRSLPYAVKLGWWVLRCIWSALTGARRPEPPDKPQKVYTWAEVYEMERLGRQRTRLGSVLGNAEPMQEVNGSAG